MASRKTDTRSRRPVLECPDCLARRESVGHSALKELSAASDLVLSLREEKHALKEALQSSLTKSDELYEKVLACNHTLKDEIRRRKAAEEELIKTRGDLSICERKLEETKEQLISRGLELQRLERSVDRSNREAYISNLEVSNRALKEQVSELSEELEAKGLSNGKTSRKVEKYCNFISAKLQDMPDYLALFRGRFKNVNEFKAVEREGGLLKVLQFLADLLTYEAQQLSSPRRRQDLYSDEEPDTRIDNGISLHLRSLDKSMQTRSEKSTNTREAELPGVQASGSIVSSIFEKHRTPSLGKDNSFNTLYQTTFETPRNTHYKESYMRDGSYNTGFSDTSGLIDVLSFQNEKLNRLNQQIAETMASSRSLLGPKSYEARAKSAARGYVGVNSGESEKLEESGPVRKLNKVRSEKGLVIPRPPPLDLELESPKKSRNVLGSPSAGIRNSTKATAKPTPTSFKKRHEGPELELPGKTEFLKSPKASMAVRLKSPTSFRNTPTSRPKQSTERKGDPKKETNLKTMPPMRPDDCWKSVGDFFGGEEDDKKSEATEGVKQS